jgi:hypothetical protein
VPAPTTTPTADPTAVAPPPAPPPDPSSAATPDTPAPAPSPRPSRTATADAPPTAPSSPSPAAVRSAPSSRRTAQGQASRPEPAIVPASSAGSVTDRAAGSSGRSRARDGP